MKEDDGVIDGVYCSEQPLLSAGFLEGKDDNQFYALTSINTLEICNLETADLFTKITAVSFLFTFILNISYSNHKCKKLYK